MNLLAVDLTPKVTTPRVSTKPRTYPFPARPMNGKDFENINDMALLWNRIKDTFDDEGRKNWQWFIEGMTNGQILLVDVGDGAGVLWLFGMKPGASANIGYAFWGSWREFVKKYGPGHAAMRAIVDWVMKEFKLFKLRAFISTDNEKSWKMAERMGFDREGTTRKEKLVDGVYTDVHVYGLIKE